MNWRNETTKVQPTTVCERAGRHIQVNEVTADNETRDFTCAACGEPYTTTGYVAREWRA